ncbi:HAD family hydrolase [Marinilactibacillus piezotolerans]|uniref:HAD family hydrolase n=1 Tax=Marinilactibacillus piezotolerans TaxID=258723 RepID=UPI0009AFBCB5|nr:HAD family hydrolase [Marinilactibacillus piezotolerans]
MIKLVITDLDGTFLNSQGSFDHERYQKAQRLMDEKGVTFAICTGKQCERVEELFEESGSDHLWILGDSATRIKHAGEYVYESLLPNDIGKRIIKKLEEIADDHAIIACTPTSAYIKDTTPEAVVEKIRGSYTRIEKVPEFQHIEEAFVKITIYDPVLRCYDSVKQLVQFQEDAFIVASEAAWIDIANKGVHKGTTVAELQKILGAARSETMVFGDGYNDRELLASGDYSFAMQNAFDEVKDIANYVTKSNDQQGVLKAIEQFISLQEH